MMMFLTADSVSFVLLMALVYSETVARPLQLDDGVVSVAV